MIKIYRERAPAELSRYMDVVKKLYEAYLSSTQGPSKVDAQAGQPSRSSDLGDADIALV